MKNKECETEDLNQTFATCLNLKSINYYFLQTWKEKFSDRWRGTNRVDKLASKIQNWSESNIRFLKLMSEL